MEIKKLHNLKKVQLFLWLRSVIYVALRRKILMSK